MSGPKISVYSLNGRARAVVMGQIRCEQQAVACAEQTKQMLNHLRTFSGNFEREIANIQLLMRRTGEGNGQIEKIQQYEEKLSKEILEIHEQLKNHMPHISPKYSISEEAYEEKQAELKVLQVIRKKTEDLQTELDAIFLQNQNNISNIQSNILKDLGVSEDSDARTRTIEYMLRDKTHNIVRIQESIIDDISGIYSFDLWEDEQDEPKFSVEKRKSELRTELVSMLKEYTLPGSIVKEIQQADRYLQRISDVNYLNTFEAVTLNGIKKKITDYYVKQIERRKELDELFARYKVLCVMAGENSKEYNYKEEAVNILSTEIKRLEKILVKQHEQEYINECVNEVMTEMGYDLIGERVVKKRSGKKFRNELFTFNEGTAVNITYSLDGQISMELGGVSREERVPNQEECEMLTRDMEVFCGEFVEFERRLREKGVMINNRIALMPPSSEYATIINVTDYNVEEGTQITEMKAVDRKKRVTEKKIMRRTE